MANYIKIGADWKTIVNYFVHAGGSFKGLINGWINIAGVWKSFFEATLAPQSTVIISQSTNGTTYLTTLTGTNYYWSPGPPSLTYRFQWWNGVSWSDISTDNAINPAYGGSTSYTQLLQSTGPSVYVQPNQVNRFRFKVDGTYGAQSASSISSETTIQGPTSITLTAGSAGLTSVDLSWTASTGANRYMIYYSTNNSVFTLFGGTSLTSATVTGLVSATLYYFKIIPITGFSNDTGYYGSYSNTVSQSTLTPQYTVTWNANGGTGGGSTTQNAGVAHTAPSATRSGYTLNGYYNTPTGDYTYGPISVGGSFTPPSTITMYARWTLTPIIPTITMGANSGITQTSGTINWTSTNQASFSSSGTISGTGSTGTSVTNNSLSAGTNYTGTVTVTSSTGNTASANYSLTTSVAQYTVTWNANGGTVSPSSNTVNAGSSVTAPTPTRSGFTFVRWTDTPSGDYTYTVLAGGSFTPPSTITMYARWTAISVPSGGTVSLTGNSTAGSVITASTSGWSGSPTSYDVFITTTTSGTPTSSSSRVSSSGGASSTTYTITSSDAISPVNIFRSFATATNAGGTSGTVQSSNTISASSSSPATAPGIPGTPTNGWTSGLSYPFSWTAATPGTVSGGGAATISSYQIRIYRASDSAGTGSTLYNTYTSVGSGTSYTFTAPDGLYYAASVSATNSAGLTSSSYSGISAYK